MQDGALVDAEIPLAAVGTDIHQAGCHRCRQRELKSNTAWNCAVGSQALERAVSVQSSPIVPGVERQALRIDVRLHAQPPDLAKDRSVRLPDRQRRIGWV